MKYFKTITLFLFAFLSVFAEVPEKPSPAKLYNDFTPGQSFIGSQEAIQIEKRLEEFYHQTSNQICIVIVDDLLGNDASQYAFEIGNKWGVGSKDFNNGVVILIKPTGGAGERDLFIATGYGLEGAIPDLATKQIRENEMVPFLKEGQNYQALINAINAIEKAAKGEYNVEVKKKRKVSAKTIFIIIAIIIFIIWVSKQPPRGGSYSRGGWHGGYGRSFGGSSSSGGFGGFRGGSFGGGGSGGKW